MKVVFISTCKNIWSCGSVGLDDIKVTPGDCALLGKQASFMTKHCAWNLLFSTNRNKLSLLQHPPCQSRPTVTLRLVCVDSLRIRKKTQVTGCCLKDPHPHPTQGPEETTPLEWVSLHPSQKPLPHRPPFKSTSCCACCGFGIYFNLLILGHYLHIEASMMLPGNKARLLSSSLRGSRETQCLQFYYHMYGSGIGQLSVYLQTGQENQDKLLWTSQGEQGISWLRASVNYQYDHQHQVSCMQHYVLVNGP